ncbi:hypothetical protein JDV02_002253 [Purpureocillium takamizusanense]|uniref:F-box domain-containing protein n=1 Tax=Purpureocillium takamizusanense TaxID=2060973 RepID=A0A9Q8QAJ6_9HYPO|nr:uncharacterized protein JDV02_002253 [Purpureocillium takamizusanense]UNI15747.1 hypothetical protein JDV02_002253 [Purpureocillium takamizusanense]
MLEIVTCCCCGAGIKDEDEAPLAPWMTLYRAVYVEDGRTAPARLSGVSLRRDERQDPPFDCVVLDDDESILDEPTPSTELIRLMRKGFNDPPVPPADSVEEGRWGFPFHSSCWDIMASVVDGLDTSSRGLQALFNVLRSFPCPQGVMYWGHSYLGLYQITADTEFLSTEDALVIDNDYPFELEESSPEEVEAWDPLEEDHLAGKIIQWKEEFVPSRQPSPNPFLTDDVSGGGRLSQLPYEVITEIFAHLRSCDVYNLRLASRRIALMPLADTFFHSRFRVGHEFAHVWEAHDVEDEYRGKWRMIYMNYRAMYHHPALVNRKRVYKLAVAITTLVDQVFGVPCDGTPIPEPEPGSDEVTTDNNGAKGEASTSKWIEDQKQPFLIHTSGFVFRRIHLPDVDKIRSVAVCTVSIFGEKFVSGLQFESIMGQRQNMGYVSESTLQTLTWPECDDHPDGFELYGFHLAIDNEGVRGIAAVTFEQELSAWISDRADIPKRRLVIGRSPPTVSKWPTRLSQISAGFDGLRLLSMSLRSLHCPAPDQDEEGLDQRDSVSWIPDVPPMGLIYGLFTTLSGTSAMRFSTSRPCFVGFFGGPEAVLPDDDKLTITVHINAERRIVGIQTHLLLGDHTNVIGQEAETHNSFQIDFSDGERLTNIIHRRHRYGPDEITIYTSKRRVGRLSAPLASSFGPRPKTPALSFIHDAVGIHGFMENGLLEGIGLVYRPREESEESEEEEEEEEEDDDDDESSDDNS